MVGRLCLCGGRIWEGFRREFKTTGFVVGEAREFFLLAGVVGPRGVEFAVVVVLEDGEELGEFAEGVDACTGLGLVGC